MNQKILFSLLFLSSVAARADLSCYGVGHSGATLKFVNSDLSHVKATVKELAGTPVLYLGARSVTEPDVFNEQVYALASSIGQNAKLTITQMPTLLGRSCGRGICQDPPTHAPKETAISAKLETPGKILSFHCNEALAEADASL